jgi:hypothetical protein
MTMSRFLSITLLAASTLGFAGAARAETPAAPGVVVQIAGAAMLPERLNLASGQHVVFHNDSPAFARVELDLPHGQGIRCASSGEEPTRGRKFVVAIGASLDCETPPTAIGYRVFHSGDGGVVESSGRIEVPD